MVVFFSLVIDLLSYGLFEIIIFKILFIPGNHDWVFLPNY